MSQNMRGIMFSIWRDNPELYFTELKRVTLTQVKKGLIKFSLQAKADQIVSDSDNTIDQVEAAVRDE